MKRFTHTHLLTCFFTLLSLMTTGSAFAQTDSGQPLPLILITSFEPFGGGKINHSALVSKDLVKYLANSFEVAECLLPVTYDQSLDVAQQCLFKLPRKPDLIISLGEGNNCNILDLETKTENLDDDGADNAGVDRQGHVIIPGAPSTKPIVFFPGQIDEALVGIKSIIKSDTMGHYVCNNLAFNMVTYLENYSLPTIPYTFVHVPSHSCGRSGLKISVVARSLALMLKRLKPLIKN